MKNDNKDLVLRDFSCPHCYEQRADCLIVRADDSIECATCGAIYQIVAGKAVEYPIKPDGMSDADWKAFQQFERDCALEKIGVLCTPADAERAGALDLD